MDEKMQGFDISFGKTRQNHQGTCWAPYPCDNVTYTKHLAATV